MTKNKSKELKEKILEALSLRRKLTKAICEYLSMLIANKGENADIVLPRIDYYIHKLDECLDEIPFSSENKLDKAFTKSKLNNVKTHLISVMANAVIGEFGSSAESFEYMFEELFGIRDTLLEELQRVVLNDESNS